MVINEGHKPTFVVANRQEVLDITFASADLVRDRLVRRWRVDDKHYLSDHRCIRFNLSGALVECQKMCKTDWRLFEKTCERRLEDSPLTMTTDTPDVVDARASQITFVLQSALEEASHTVTGHRKLRNPWWSGG